LVALDTTLVPPDRCWYCYLNLNTWRAGGRSSRPLDQCVVLLCGYRLIKPL